MMRTFFTALRPMDRAAPLRVGLRTPGSRSIARLSRLLTKCARHHSCSRPGMNPIAHASSLACVFVALLTGCSASPESDEASSDSDQGALELGSRARSPLAMDLYVSKDGATARLDGDLSKQVLGISV